jgi:hypothetical protein
MSRQANPPDQDDSTLAADIVDAMKQVDAATATRNEKAIVAGRLLIEAQKRHPTEKAFAEFLQLAGGIHIRRARDLIALAQWRKDFEQHQIEHAAAQQRYRDKLKAEKIEREKEKAALPKPDPKPDPKPKPKDNGRPEPKPAESPASRDAAVSEKNLLEFEFACRTYLPKLNLSDLEKAEELFRDLKLGCRIKHIRKNKETA